MFDARKAPGLLLVESAGFLRTERLAGPKLIALRDSPCGPKVRRTLFDPGYRSFPCRSSSTSGNSSADPADPPVSGLQDCNIARFHLEAASAYRCMDRDSADALLLRCRATSLRVAICSS